MFWQAREPGANAANIDVPVFGCLTWQDDEVSSRGSSYLSRLDPAHTWVVASNGYHGMCEISAPQITDELIGFFNRFVKGEANGFENTPHVQVWHEATANGARGRRAELGHQLQLIRVDSGPAAYARPCTERRALRHPTKGRRAVLQLRVPRAGPRHRGRHRLWSAQPSVER